MDAVDASDLKKLAVDIDRAGGAVGTQVAAVVRKTALQIEKDAKIAAPVDTGNLRNSVSTTITGDGRFGSIEAEVGPTASYGGYVELGTSRMAPEPYLGPAFDRDTVGFDAALAEMGVGRL